MSVTPPLTVPSIQSAPLYHAQAVPDITDFLLLSGTGTGCGWLTGAQVGVALDPATHQITFAVSVSAGTVSVGGHEVAVPPTTLPCPPPNTTDRRDIVLVGATGVPYFKAGVPAPVTNWTIASPLLPPLKPAPDPNTVVLAEVYIPGNIPPPNIPISAGMITDKRTPWAALSVGAVVQGIIADAGGEERNVKNPFYGAFGDYLGGFTDGAMSNLSPADPFVFTAAVSALFVPGDVGKTIIIQGAGTAGAPLITTIATWINGATVELTAPTQRVIANAAWAYGHDDTAAIQKALNQGPGSILMPWGNYLILGQLRTQSNQFFHGSCMGATTITVGTKLTGSVGGQPWSAAVANIDVSNVVLSDFTVDLNEANTLNGGDDRGQNGVLWLAHTAGVQNCHAERVETKNGWYFGLRSSSFDTTLPLEVEIDKCRANSNGGGGMWLVGLSDLKVRGSQAMNNGSQRWGGSGIVWGNCLGVEITGNLLSGNWNHGCSSADLTDALYFLITNNISVNNGISGSNFGWGVVASGGAAFFLIDSNICFNNHNGGVTVDVATGDHVIKVAVGSVTGNMIRGGPQQGTTVNGINLNWTAYVTVTGNQIYGVANNGIAGSDAFGCHITGNDLVGCGTNGVALFKSGLASTNPGQNTIGPNTYLQCVANDVYIDPGMDQNYELDRHLVQTTSVQLGLAVNLYSGIGAPNFSAKPGDRYYRQDTPNTAGLREYICNAPGNSWIALAT